jgi:coproporphyrinogen III oxidase-like Fe-S oxidoreductase
MYGFANQENSDVIKTIEHIIEIDPEFVTLYPMRYK